MEKLFTNEELFLIVSEATSNENYYLDTHVLNGEATETSIITISKNNSLIFVEGNGDTGFKHIRERHSALSFMNYWIPNEQSKLKLDNPSKFNPRMMPIIDYVKIADQIFSVENKNVTRNKNPNLFDKYTGNYIYSENQCEKYHLITYKDTKIVHSLFPDKKGYNAKRKCKFGKGIVKTYLKFSEGINDLIVPYVNESGNTVYSILVRKYYSEKIEKVFVRKHAISGTPIESFYIGRRMFEDFETFGREELNYFQLSELGEFESIITKIDEGNIDS